MKRILAFRNCWNGLGPRGTDLIGGVGYYRIQKPAQFLRHKYDIFEFGDLISTHKKLKSIGKDWSGEDMVPNLIKECDLVWMKNVSHPGGLAWFAGAADYYKKPLIVDMDDNYMAVDDLNPKRKYFHETADANIVHKELFKAATAMIVATEPLKKVYQELNPNVHVIPNYNDVEDWKFKKAKRSDGRIVIGWAGSQTHEADFQVIKPVIERIWDKYGEKVVFAVCGGLPQRLIEQLPKGSTIVYSGTRTMRDYHQRLASWGFDIGLAPLKESAFNDGKGHGKWMEYSMYRIPLVASRFGPYKRVVEDGVTGLLAGGTDEWVEQLDKLIGNPSLGQKIGQAAYDEVVKNHQWKDNWSEWETVFNTYIGKGFAKQI